MTKKMLSMITALTVAAGASGIAGARSMPANLGTARIGSTVGQFNYELNTGAVTATGVPPGPSLANWQIGLVLDFPGVKTATVASRAFTPAGAPRWRLACANQLGTAISSSPLVPIPVGFSYALTSATAPFVPPGGVCFIDAFLNNGASLHSVNYNP